MRGRKPKSEVEKRITGNPGKRSVPVEPKPKAGILTPPDWLPEDAKEAWGHVLSVMPKGVITLADRDTLAAYCSAVAILKAAQLELSRNIADGMGLTVETERGWVKNPIVTVIDTAQKQVRSLGSELGLTPAARARLGHEPEGEKPKDEWAELEECRSAVRQ